MSVNLFAAGELFWQELADELAEEGMAVVRSVRLPDSFQPPLSDVVFLVCAEGIEIYLDARIEYGGHSAIWRQIQEQPPLPGPARLVAQADLEAGAAFRLLRTLLLDAGGALGEAEEEQAEIVPQREEAAQPEALREMLATLASEAGEQPVPFVAETR